MIRLDERMGKLLLLLFSEQKRCGLCSRRPSKRTSSWWAAAAKFRWPICGQLAHSPLASPDFGRRRDTFFSLALFSLVGRRKLDRLGGGGGWKSCRSPRELAKQTTTTDDDKLAKRVSARRPLVARRAGRPAGRLRERASGRA